MPLLMKFTATIVRTLVVSDDEELDDICEDIHEQLDRMMFSSGWEGETELSYEVVAPEEGETDG